MRDYGGLMVSDRIGNQLKASKQDEEVTRDLLLVIKNKDLTVERASSILADAQTLLMALAKLP